MVLAICCAASRLAEGAPATAAEETVTLRSERLSLKVPAKERRLGERVLEHADSAFEKVLDQMPEPFDERVVLVWCSTEKEFYGRVGAEIGEVLAAAAPSIRRVYLNGERLQRLERTHIHETLLHEFVHIYLGRRIPWRIPLWLNEGLAMIVSEHWGMEDATALAADGLFRFLYSPQELDRKFPTSAGPKRRAYRQSHSMTAFLIEQRYSKSGVQGLIEDLLQPPGKRALRTLLSDPDWLARFDAQWRQQRVKPGQLMLFLTSSGTLWLALTFLLIFAYRRKRRKRKQRESQWAWEEEFGYYDDGFDD